MPREAVQIIGTSGRRALQQTSSSSASAAPVTDTSLNVTDDGTDYTLSACSYPNGYPAWTSPDLGPNSLSINETAYITQFPINVTQYP